MKRRLVLAAAPVLALSSMRLASAQGTADTPRRLAERFAATLTAHDMAGFAVLFADDYKNHQVSAAAPPPATPTGITAKQGSVNFFAARVAAMPDLIVEIEAIVAEPAKVAASFVYHGTHTGAAYLGFPPDGKALRFTSCDIFTVTDGKFSEHWGMGDIAGILAQLKA